MQLLNERRHRHHIIPKHMGGTDDPSNLTPPISVELHAEFHRMLWLDHGHKQDYIAWQALSGRMTSEEARLAAAKEGQGKSAKYKESRKLLGIKAQQGATPESRSKGGKTASVALVAWQKANREQFLRRAAENGRIKAPKQWIKHEYQGVVYESKKELQAATGLSNCGFYGKLRRGEIKRLDREIQKRAAK